MDSEEPPNVRVACSGDIDEVVRLMHDAAAWMSAKGTPAWDVARIDRTFAETFVLRSELLVASCSDGIDSNRIEGNSTVPADVLRAQDLPADVRAGEELLEIKRHIEAQKRLSDDPIDEVDICTNGAISRMHREFYEGMPEEFLQIKVNEEGETVRLVPGEFRDQGVKVGNHIPPAAENLRTYMGSSQKTENKAR